MKIALRFYYTGGSPLSESARQELKDLQNQFFKMKFEIEEIDVVLHPLMAEEAGILATPTIIKLSPPPVTKVVGDMKDLANSFGLNKSGRNR